MKVTRFCVQPFERSAGRLVAGEPHQFYSEAMALAFGRRAQRRAAGLAIFSIQGWPVQNVWAKPKMLLRVGDVPPGFDATSCD